MPPIAPADRLDEALLGEPLQGVAELGVGDMDAGLAQPPAQLDAAARLARSSARMAPLSRSRSGSWVPSSSAWKV